MTDLGAMDRMNLIYLVVLLAVVILMRGTRWREGGWLRNLRLALLWVLIFVVGFIAFAFRDELRPLGQRLMAEVDPSRPVVQGDHVVIRRSLDGHFRVKAMVNGVEVPFVVDSGASGIALTADAAQAAGFDLETLNFSGTAMTASGMARTAAVRIDSFAVGPIELNRVGAVVLPIADGESLLGMTFLNTLAGWQVEGNEMRLIPHPVQSSI